MNVGAIDVSDAIPPQDGTLEDFIRHFEARAPWVVLVGAGVSVGAPANVPSAPPIVDALLDALAAAGDARDALAGARERLRRGHPGSLTRYMPFEAILGEVGLHAPFIDGALDELFPRVGRAAPNADHHAIAALVRRGYVDLVLTANIDECLEAALAPTLVSVQWRVGPVPNQRPALMKLHGTASEPASRAATPTGIATRVNDDTWQASLIGALALRDVLVVGYAFRDFLDISPVLDLAAKVYGTRFVWARHATKLAAPRVQLAGSFTHELGSSDRDVLLRLCQRIGEKIPSGDRWMSLDEQRVVARREIDVALAREPLDAASRLKAFGALFYWLEDGIQALDLFVRARRVDEHSVDNHLLVRALLRARRYGSAKRLLRSMLQRELPRDLSRRLEREVDWWCAAGHAAAAGGRPILGASHFRSASAALAKAGRPAETLTPYLADQYLRGRAANEIRLALASRDVGARNARLAVAEELLRRMATVRNVELKTRPHLWLDQARIHIARGEHDVAQARLRLARRHMAYWGDDHDLAVCDRLLAAARDPRARRLLAAQLGRCAREGHWLELAKMLAAWFGWHGFVWWQARVRHRFVRVWDRVKDLVSPATLH